MLKKSKEQILQELDDELNSTYVNSNLFSKCSPDSVMYQLDIHIKECIKKAVEVVIKNSYCQEDFERDVGVRNEDQVV